MDDVAADKAQTSGYDNHLMPSERMKRKKRVILVYYEENKNTFRAGKGGEGEGNQE